MALALACSAIVFAQEGTKEEPKLTVAPTATVFTKYTHGLGNESEVGGFDLDRAYLGAKFKYGSEFSGQVLLDFGSTKLDGSALDFVAYVKNASMTWKRSNFETSFGLIKTTNFAYQESFWGYRYVAKTYMDEMKYASSADFGISAAYKFTDWMKVDLQIVNGEGYKHLELDNDARFGLGVTVEPITNLFVRGYYDICTSTKEGDKTINSASLFAGYKSDIFTIGAEYNRLWNRSFAQDNNYTGISFYSTVFLSKKFEVFARYDQTITELDSAPDAGSVIIAGLEYTPCKVLKLSPNISYNNPTGEDNNEIFINLSAQVKF